MPYFNKGYLMVQSKLMPVQVKILNLRWRYKKQGLRCDLYYHVIGYDTKRMIITSEKADRAYTVKWKDVDLVKSELTVSQTRPATALLLEMQLLRGAMSKLSSAIPKLKNIKQPENFTTPKS
jgi:hypothetical protein